VEKSFQLTQERFNILLDITTETIITRAAAQSSEAIPIEGTPLTRPQSIIDKVPSSQTRICRRHRTTRRDLARLTAISKVREPVLPVLLISSRDTPQVAIAVLRNRLRDSTKSSQFKLLMF
jgi:hypothetical protein